MSSRILPDLTLPHLNIAGKAQPHAPCGNCNFRLFFAQRHANKGSTGDLRKNARPTDPGSPTSAAFGVVGVEAVSRHWMSSLTA